MLHIGAADASLIFEVVFLYHEPKARHDAAPTFTYAKQAPAGGRMADGLFVEPNSALLQLIKARVVKLIATFVQVLLEPLFVVPS